MYIQPRCQNKDCQYHQNPDPDMLIKKGKDKRKNKTVQRYQCKSCGQQFTSSALQDVSFHNPELLYEIYLRLTSGYTVARLCEELGVSKTTTLKMIQYLGKKCREYHQNLLDTGFLTTNKIYFDEMMTHIHGKSYPVSIGLAVDVKYKRIIDIKIAETWLRGKLPAKIIKEKGSLPEAVANHPNNTAQMLEDLMTSIRKSLTPLGFVYSDKWSSYANTVERCLPKNIFYIQEASKTDLNKSVDKQGLGRFRSICAYLRSNIGPIARRSLNTAKTTESLEDHFYIAIARYNKYDLYEVLQTGNIQEDFFERQWRIKKELKQLKVFIAIATYSKFLKNQKRIEKLKATLAKKKAEKNCQVRQVS